MSDHIPRQLLCPLTLITDIKNDVAQHILVGAYLEALAAKVIYYHASDRSRGIPVYPFHFGIAGKIPDAERGKDQVPPRKTNRPPRPSGKAPDTQNAKNQGPAFNRKQGLFHFYIPRRAGMEKKFVSSTTKNASDLP